MNVLDIVAGTADAAFATDEGGVIVTWNQAATRLLGFGASRVVGRTCHEVLCGLDAAGERLCDPSCPWVRNARRCPPVSDFEVAFRDAAGDLVRTRVSAMVVPAEDPAQFFVVHLLEPVAATGDGAPSPASPRGDSSDPPESAGDAPTMPSRSPLTGVAARLSAREREVLALLATGVGTRDIGARLGIRPATVRNHVQRILRKLGVHSRSAALEVARRAGLG